MADKDSIDDKELLARARQVSENAYAIYSDFRVGCAILDEDGRVFVGCNVENISYGLTICAERAALCAAVAAGASRILRVAIFATSKKIVTPCGACRQVLLELAADATVLLSCESKARRVRTVRELLPEGFSKSGWK